MSRLLCGSTPVEIPVGQLIGAVAAILVAGIGAFWVIADFTTAGLREDVSAIRSTLGTLQGSDKNNALNIKQAELDFSRQIGGLNVSLAQFGAKVDGLSGKLDAMDKSMLTLSAQMEFVGARQSAPLDPEALAAALKRAGYEGKVVVLVQPAPAPDVRQK